MTKEEKKHILKLFVIGFVIGLLSWFWFVLVMMIFFDPD